MKRRKRSRKPAPGTFANAAENTLFTCARAAPWGGLLRADAGHRLTASPLVDDRCWSTSECFNFRVIWTGSRWDASCLSRIDEPHPSFGDDHEAAVAWLLGDA